MNSQMLASGLLLAAIFLASLHSNAQGNESVQSQSELQTSKNILLSTDITPVLLGGFGIAADGAVVEKASLGAFYLQMKPKTFQDLVFTESEIEMKTYGLRGRFYINRTFSESGWYVGAAAVKSESKVKARSTFLGDGPWGEGKKEKTGAQGSLGYQFIGRKSDSGQFAFNIAYIYGSGNKFGYDYSSSNGSATVDPILEDGSSFEGTLGWMF